MVGWNGVGMGVNYLVARAFGCLGLAGNTQLITVVQKRVVTRPRGGRGTNNIGGGRGRRRGTEIAHQVDRKLTCHPSCDHLH
jgi:hypothetical protein